MNPLPRLKLMFKASKELGLRQMGLYAWYRAALWSGYLRVRTPSRRSPQDLAKSTFIPRGREGRFKFAPVIEPPERELLLSALGQDGLARLENEAQEILDGYVRLFGGDPVQLELEFPYEMVHWTKYERDNDLWQGMDPKFIWEPGRFSWACTLARAYYLLGDERYAQAFWRYTEAFLKANPPNIGPQWVSAQEVALRLIALVFALGIFASSNQTASEKLVRLVVAIADHAERIPPTLAYARSQNNNHLLTEAVGLYTAGACLPDHPRAEGWKKLGWRWINRSLQTQIDAEGAYIQHSTNYHRLMLQSATWAQAVARSQDTELPIATRQRLAAAVDWLFALLDDQSGQVPNLGHNDGANILPLTVRPFYDYRPALQAASQAFTAENRIGAGPWDEMNLWLNGRLSEGGIELDTGVDKRVSTISNDGGVVSLQSRDSRAYLRVARFHSRPAHADQLHLDLWWHGVNLAIDPGTYLYNAPPPWDNSLTSTQHHNTVMLDGEEQMARAGRFLYLDWAQARVNEHTQADDGSGERVIAEHDGYENRGAIHRRILTVYKNDHWIIQDLLLPANSTTETRRGRRQAQLHWLLPDWNWELKQEGENKTTFRIFSPRGWITLQVECEGQPGMIHSGLRHQLIRAGELLYGDGAPDPTMGWFSPTYGYKEPALSFSSQVRGSLPIKLKSEWILPSA